MRIAIVSETYPPEINGVALTVRGMVESLKVDHQVSVFRPRQGKDDQPAREGNLTEHLMPSLPLPRYEGLRFGLPASRRISKVLDAAPFDALYISTEGPLGWSALRSGLKRGIPVLTGFHTRFDQYASHYGIGVAERGVAAYLRRFHNRATGTLIPTQELKADLEDKGYQNVMLLPRAVDTDLFNPSRRSEALRREWGLDEDDLAVLYVGRLAAEKNLDLAIRAFENIIARRPRARFVLVGDGPAREHLAQRYPNFIFTGLKLGEDLAAHYASGDLFVFPSLTETFGNVVLESLASGVPVLAFRYAAAAEYIRNGYNGFVAPCSDEEGFVQNAAMLAELARELPDLHTQARRCVEHLNPASVATHLVELFRSFDQELAA
ncbi:MAG: glycosyltransferase family 1 protein [Pseudomonadota bacterium]